MTYGFDAVGRLTSASSATDTLGWTYDLVGQALTASSTTNSANLEYEYDLGGNRKTVKLDGALFTTYGYDDASRLTSITRPGVLPYGFEYYDDSRRKRLTFPNGLTTDYTYDTRGRVTDILYRLAGQTVTRTTYPLYDEVGNRRQKGGDFVEDYAYDELYRLRQVKRGPTITESYTYDDVGNRRSSLQHPNWVYPANSNRLESYNGTSFGYDANGSMTSKTEAGNDWVYEWNAENHLTRVTQNGAEVARFAYDPLGRRIQKMVGTSTHAWLYDGKDILREIDGTSTFKFVQGPGIDEPLARETDVNPTIYAHVDGLGSLVKATGGQTTFTRKYDAFGNMEQGAAAASYAFTGREWDPEMGLYYYRARYYDPKIGRFISEDPIQAPAREVRELNAYAYVANNPVNETDPFGLAIWVCNRKAFTRWGPGNHSYYWDDRNGACCGRGSTKSCKEKGPPTDDCRKVEGSDGREEETLGCCRAIADQGLWFPGLNDCQTAVNKCLAAKNLKNPGAPGGRFGRPCDPCNK